MKCSIKKIYLQLIIHTAIYLRNTYISNTISSRCILITYVDFYVLVQAFPVIPLANFFHSSIDATVASRWRRVNMAQDLVSVFLISHNLLVYVHMWGIYMNVCGGIYTNAPVSAIIDHSYRHFYEVL